LGGRQPSALSRLAMVASVSFSACSAATRGDVPAVVATGDGAGHVTRPSVARQRELARYLYPAQL
jgi:hypothetical protein